jgi:hypothetical protein
MGIKNPHNHSNERQDKKSIVIYISILFAQFDPNWHNSKEENISSQSTINEHLQEIK